MSFIEDVERTEKELKFINQIEKWKKSYKKVQWIKDGKEFPERKCRSCQKSVLSTANGNSGKVTEKLFTNPRTWKRYDGVPCDRQLSLW